MASFAEIMGDDNWDEIDEGALKTGDFKPLEPGKYDVYVESLSDPKKTKSGNGVYLSLTLNVVGGEHDGRKLFETLNIVNENPTAQAIGRKALDNFRKAVGKPNANSTEELVGLSLTVKVGIDKKDPTKNRVLEYLAPLASNLPIGATAAAPSVSKGANTEQAPKRSAPSWLKR